MNDRFAEMAKELVAVLSEHSFAIKDGYGWAEDKNDMEDRIAGFLRDKLRQGEA